MRGGYKIETRVDYIRIWGQLLNTAAIGDGDNIDIGKHAQKGLISNGDRIIRLYIGTRGQGENTSGL